MNRVLNNVYKGTPYFTVNTLRLRYKGKVSVHALKACGEWRYSSADSQPRHQVEMSGQIRTSPTLLVEECAGWASEPVWTLWKSEKSVVPTGN
jgi:hypothetical protein